MAADIRRSNWLRCDLFPNQKVWTVVRKCATHHVVVELYGRRDTSESMEIEPNLCLWTGRVVLVVPGLVPPDHQGECPFTVHTDDRIVTFYAHSERSMFHWVHLLKRLLPKNDNLYTWDRARAASLSQTENTTVSRTTETNVVTANVAAATVSDYGHISPVGQNSLSPVRPNVAPTSCLEATSDSLNLDRSAAQRPRPQTKTTVDALPARTSNSTRDPTSPLPPTPDVSDSVYGAVYPIPSQTNDEQPVSQIRHHNTPLAAFASQNIPVRNVTTPPLRNGPARTPAPVSEDSGYGHISNCSSTSIHPNLDKNLLSKVWPLNWWKFSKK